MSKKSFEEVVKIFAERGLAGNMEAQAVKVPMSPRHVRSPIK